MKTIEQAAKIIYNDAKSIGAFINGAEFAESWIKVESELPPIGEKVLMKYKNYEIEDVHIGVYSGYIHELLYIVEWRPINRS
jgi:hypothetical protein